MLKEYSKIDHRIRALKTGQIVTWKGEKKGLHYVNGISVD
ncbi:hypothetical protein SAMN05216167_1506 [Spirosoma endophyticum]|uniref:Uncharacterized protein n=1 Tax=Spirosoma endophyticum TaxID=662367 RepID=A0A1I2HWI4_9BACT|nr:hypothetical protein SAMN05216167_1506 [Spirosoma endophyticum]